ncbi:Imm63 family immunity protein [Fictibacillus sp. b24]|uniref:Imm63 family immunity protein n=1 Tax=Fictibacillus sp. b24 TaxID=3055863 RepID=UPI0025A17B35|nr:Imm63 family immunity protein [Fictibacillus sp. b24]MDM5317240.1 Imm63 family immunity protein [Fictibacillus sp. b24]
MDKESLESIKNVVDHYAELINVHTYHLTYGFSKDFAIPHIEVNESGYHYVVIERGIELKRLTTNDIDELLFAIFNGITYEVALNYEVENRVKNQDSRIISFKKQEELLGVINEKWKMKQELYHREILKRSPYKRRTGNEGLS